VMELHNHRELVSEQANVPQVDCEVLQQGHSVSLRRVSVNMQQDQAKQVHRDRSRVGRAKWISEHRPRISGGHCTRQVRGILHVDPSIPGVGLTNWSQPPRCQIAAAHSSDRAPLPPSDRVGATTASTLVLRQQTSGGFGRAPYSERDRECVVISV
jgi:hypothetical protein